MAVPELIPMRTLGYDERALSALLARWLPQVDAPDGPALLRMTRTPEQTEIVVCGARAGGFHRGGKNSRMAEGASPPTMMAEGASPPTMEVP